MRRRHRTRGLRRLVLGPTARILFRDPAAAAESSRRATLRPAGVDPTHAPAGASGARPAPFAARAAHSTRRLSTAAAA
jgi:hypothetical protein